MRYNRPNMKSSRQRTLTDNNILETYCGDAYSLLYETDGKPKYDYDAVQDIIICEQVGNEYKYFVNIKDPGKIVKANLDGTYGVQFDDGNHLSAVPEFSIKNGAQEALWHAAGKEVWEPRSHKWYNWSSNTTVDTVSLPPRAVKWQDKPTVKLNIGDKVKVAKKIPIEPKGAAQGNILELRTCLGYELHDAIVKTKSCFQYADAQSTAAQPTATGNLLVRYLTSLKMGESDMNGADWTPPHIPIL